MQSPPLSIGLTGTQLAILIIMIILTPTGTQLAILIILIILALCAAFMLGALSQRNQTHEELLSGQKKQRPLNNQGTDRPEQLEQLSKIPSDSIEQVQPDSRLPKEMSLGDENSLQHGEGEVEAVNREEEPNALPLASLWRGCARRGDGSGCGAPGRSNRTGVGALFRRNVADAGRLPGFGAVRKARDGRPRAEAPARPVDP